MRFPRSTANFAGPLQPVPPEASVRRIAVPAVRFAITVIHYKVGRWIQLPGQSLDPLGEVVAGRLRPQQLSDDLVERTQEQRWRFRLREWSTRQSSGRLQLKVRVE